ncbi:hypothetical protein BO78DRAFT_174489 [Aspergillus sclerotiicarbonarius CBS 121057]|uniref:Uncharacterized protein n=1 Tax=Aspergillus sclerotiicarbonarius (strain CBS 121057 / IBT 28362) TaxID=1448318 RepID=A0A319E2H7_ASPSB|nr:hypothetical protein BO78DRAFT_174489 [Aspergillus sclerotiicarbonarius CBS 121057]
MPLLAPGGFWARRGAAIFVPFLSFFFFFFPPAHTNTPPNLLLNLTSFFLSLFLIISPPLSFILMTRYGDMQVKGVIKKGHGLGRVSSSFLFLSS